MRPRRTIARATQAFASGAQGGGGGAENGNIVGRDTYPDILLAFSQTLSVCLDLLIDAVANALGIGLALQPGDAFVFGLRRGGPEEGREWVGIGGSAVDGWRPGGCNHGGVSEAGGPWAGTLGGEVRGKGGGGRSEDGFIEFMCRRALMTEGSERHSISCQSSEGMLASGPGLSVNGPHLSCLGYPSGLISVPGVGLPIWLD